MKKSSGISPEDFIFIEYLFLQNTGFCFIWNVDMFDYFLGNK